MAKVLFITEDYIIDPLGIAYLSAYLKSFGHCVDIVNFDIENLGSRVLQFKPDVYAYSVTTGRHTLFRDINQQAKGIWNATSFFGGPHCTFYPDFVDNAGIDAVCVGEGFTAFKEFLDDPTSKTEGIHTSSHETYTFGSLIDKDTIPFPDRSLIYKYTQNKENPIRSIISSFECGLGCRYCYAPKYRDLYGLGSGFKQIRTRTPAWVCEEARSVKKDWVTELFYFQDDVFPVWKKGFVDEFCKHWDSGYFHIQIRAEMINTDLIRQLKSVGLHGVTFAVESGVPEIRKKVLNRKMSNKQIIRAAQILKAQGIRFRIENMMGVLGETFQDAMKTLELNIACDPDLAWASIWQPYPGTALGDEAIELGLFDPKSDEIGFDFFHKSILEGPDMHKIVNLQKLFGITVRFPILRSIIPLLCQLPANRFYDKLYKMYKMWVYENRLYNVKPHLRGSKQMKE